MSGAYEQRVIAERRLRLIEPVANGAWRKVGCSSKTEYVKRIAAREGIGERTLYRWFARWNNAGRGVAGLQALIDVEPGPDRQELEPWVALQIETDQIGASSPLSNGEIDGPAVR